MVEVSRPLFWPQKYTTSAQLFPGDSAKDLARLTKHRQLLSGSHALEKCIPEIKCIKLKTPSLTAYNIFSHLCKGVALGRLG